MEAMKYLAKVDARGRIVLQNVRLKRGTPVEVIVLVRDSEEVGADLGAASQSTLAFWDNPIDDKAWNDAGVPHP